MTLRATPVRAQALACTCAQGPRAAARCARRFLSARPADPPCCWAPGDSRGTGASGATRLPSACRRRRSRPRVPCPAFRCGRLPARAKCRLSPSPRRSVGSWKVTPGTVPDLCPDPSGRSLQRWTEGEKGDTRALALQPYHSPNISSRLPESSIPSLSPKPVSHPPTSGSLPLP